MIFSYKAITQDGQEKQGTIEVATQDMAITALQRRGLVVASLKEIEEGQGGSLLSHKVSFFESVSAKDVVMLTRQIATLFDANVSVLKAFRMLAAESEKTIIRNNLTLLADDIQGGLSISESMAKRPVLFSGFYVNMVKAGEESGKLSETFMSLADQIERSYELSSKARGAMIYPAFVIGTFVIVMILMLTMVIPKLAGILEESGQAVPVYTEVVLFMSKFLVNYGLFFLLLLIGFIVYFWKFKYKAEGGLYIDRLKLSTPYVNDLFQKLYLARISDNMDTMLSSGISMVHSLEISASVVGSKVYEEILVKAAEEVRSGVPLSDALYKYEEMPNMMIQMIRVGEETGKLAPILKTVSRFYRREVNTAVDTLVSLIEPVMIVALGLGVGILLASVLVPIYNIASSGL
jgi:type IV pilus assembly protein PilC